MQTDVLHRPTSFFISPIRYVIPGNIEHWPACQPEDFIKYQVENLRGNLSIEKLIDPSSGYLRIGTFYKQRADSLGLWRVSCNN